MRRLVVFDSLTARQLEIARLVADGRTDEQIADGLGIARRTVNGHIQRIASTWGLNTQRDLRVQITRRVLSWPRAA